MLVSFGQFPMISRSKFEGNAWTTTKFGHCNICKVTNTFKSLKLSWMVLIKFPSKDNDFKFVRSPTFEGNLIPSPNKHPTRFKWLNTSSHPKLSKSISRLGFLNMSRCLTYLKHLKLLGRFFKCLHPTNFNIGGFWIVQYP